MHACSSIKSIRSTQSEQLTRISQCLFPQHISNLNQFKPLLWFELFWLKSCNNILISFQFRWWLFGVLRPLIIMVLVELTNNCIPGSGGRILRQNTENWQESVVNHGLWSYWSLDLLSLAAHWVLTNFKLMPFQGQNTTERREMGRTELNFKEENLLHKSFA